MTGRKLIRVVTRRLYCFRRLGTAVQIESPSWTEERAEGYEPDWPSVYAQPNGEYSATQEVTGP